MRPTDEVSYLAGLSTPPMAKLRSAHLAAPPKNCRCVWCTEEPDVEAAPSLFDPEEPYDEPEETK